MAKKARGANQIQRFSPKNNSGALSKYSHPFWLPALNYYLAASALSLLIFFLVWFIFSEGVEELSWLAALFIAAAFALSAVVSREILLKNVRERFLLDQKRLDDNLANLRVQHNSKIKDTKLTIVKNTEIIDKIKKISEAAKILSNLPDGHYEVFQACNEYLSLNNKELKTVGAGSPRIAVLIKSRKTIQKLHKFHLLKWAEIQSRLFTTQANQKLNAIDKIENAEKALNVLESALQFYSEEKQLIDSRKMIKTFIVSVTVSPKIEQARQSAAGLDYTLAINLYQEALFLLSEGSIPADEKLLLANNINQEIEKLSRIGINKDRIRRFSTEISFTNEHQND